MVALLHTKAASQFASLDISTSPANSSILVKNVAYPQAHSPASDDLVSKAQVRENTLQSDCTACTILCRAGFQRHPRLQTSFVTACKDRLLSAGLCTLHKLNSAKNRNNDQVFIYIPPRAQSTALAVYHELHELLYIHFRARQRFQACNADRKGERHEQEGAAAVPGPAEGGSNSAGHQL